ncbi:MAG: SpoIIE family protein phosphatase [Melioribacteraceae bacterium]|nr:SpoIIE family protein phosphatase [Melioribacteraceae bacterium]MCF8266051.1 SpoIIE family protein phosphatase [Melioribacteraceae bacterium]MCF8412593.1 SpoIIE family protein phosphatase [Melioribacteraceae bacterium]
MKYKSVLLCIFFVGFFFNLYSQSNYQFESISVPEGLANLSVLDIYQDSFGYIWFGTQDGLNRYDGINMKLYREDPNNLKSLKGNLVLRIYEDSTGQIWVGTNAALNKYNYDTDDFESYFYEESNSTQFYNGITEIYEDSQGIFWVGRAYTGLTYFDKVNEEFVFIDSSAWRSENVFAIFSIREDSLNNLWYTAGNSFDQSGKLFRYERKTGEITNYTDSLLVNENNVGVALRMTKNSGNRVFFHDHKGHFFEVLASSGKFKSTLIDPTSVLFASYQDRDGEIWITAVNKNGSFRFNPDTDEKLFITNDPSNENSLPRGNYISAFVDDAGLVWLGSSDKGVIKFDPAKRNLNPFKIFKKGSENEEALEIFGVTEDIKENRLLILTRDGIYEFDLIMNQAKKSDLNSLFGKGERIGELFLDEERNLWIEKINQGILNYNLNTKSKKFFEYNSKDKNGFRFNDVRRIAGDSKSNIWFASDWGVIKFDKKEDRFKTFTPVGDTSYSMEFFNEIEKLRAQNRFYEKITGIGNDASISKKFKVDKAGTFLITSTGEMFSRGNNAGVYDYGFLTDSKGDSVWVYNQNKSLHAGGDPKNSILTEIIKLQPGEYQLNYISDDSHSYLEWNAPPPLYMDSYGIELFKLSESEAIYFENELKERGVLPGIVGRIVSSIYEDSKERIWIGTQQNGFSIIYPDGEIKNISLIDESPLGFNADNVTDFAERIDGKIWITTLGGLVLFDPDTEQKKYYTSSDGLATNYLIRILPFSENNSYWLSSLKGLIKFYNEDPKDKLTFISYDLKDGIQDYNYHFNSALILSDGRLFFGGTGGFNLFKPIGINSAPPKLVIDEMKISNRTVVPGEDDSPISSHISTLDSIYLDYSQNDFSFEFNALHFSRPEKNKYAYYLEGFEDDWIYDDRRYATYTNLDPGEYKLRIKAANSDGVWTEKPKELFISIAPPWWRTNLAYFIYVLFGITAFVAFDRIQKRRILTKERERQQIQEAELRAKAAEAEARAIAAENDRKTKELEEARSLQLNLLPDRLPNLPNLDIAVYMKTATEVGGDYYDFSVSVDGRLTAVIGDATGHGLNAGTVVTVTKSLFNTYAENDDILLTFREISKCLKEMKFKFLAMCLMLLKFKENELELSSAGMPPALIFRKAKNELEELLIRGMPLGATKSFPYKTVTTELNPGDTILLMSDGFPELMNPEKELLGYDKVQKVFMENAEKSPEEIITELNIVGDKWRMDKEPDDDITFVVIKMK